MLVAQSCDGCSSAPLTQYKNNPIYQEITEKDKFANNERDDRIYIDMRRSKGYTDKLEKSRHILNLRLKKLDDLDKKK